MRHSGFYRVKAGNINEKGREDNGYRNPAAKSTTGAIAEKFNKYVRLAERNFTNIKWYFAVLTGFSPFLIQGG
jgi:hypothetical protein